MIIGYARVSSESQDLEVQLQALGHCDKIFQEKISGKSVKNRPELQNLLDFARDGDTVVVYKIDRLARSLLDLLTVIEKLSANGVAFQSLSDPIDTSGPTGQLMLQVMGAFAEFERNLMQSRCKAGREHARAKGRSIGGRPRQLTRAQIAQVAAMADAGQNFVQIAKMFGVSRSTISRAVAGYRRELAGTLVGEHQQELSLNG